MIAFMLNVGACCFSIALYSYTDSMLTIAAAVFSGFMALFFLLMEITS